MIVTLQVLLCQPHLLLMMMMMLHKGRTATCMQTMQLAEGQALPAADAAAPEKPNRRCAATPTMGAPSALSTPCSSTASSKQHSNRKKHIRIVK
jgi:hypothetical protein